MFKKALIISLFLFKTSSAFALYSECPGDSKLATAKLVIAPHDCRSLFIVQYQAKDLNSGLIRNVGCATEGSIHNLFKKNELRHEDLTSQEDYFAGKGVKLEVCLKELEGHLSDDSQPLVDVKSIEQNVTENGGIVLESSKN